MKIKIKYKNGIDIDATSTNKSEYDQFFLDDNLMWKGYYIDNETTSYRETYLVQKIIIYNI